MASSEQAVAAGERLLAWQRFRHGLSLTAHWWLRAHAPYQPLFVIATHRSGSNLLIDYLNRVPSVWCQSEILCTTFDFGPSPDKPTPRRAIRHIRRSLQSANTPVRGAKFMLDQLRRFRVTPEILREAFPDARFVVLYRQSLAEQYLSIQSALATQQWSLRDGESPRQVKVVIDPADFRNYCERIRRDYQTWLAPTWLPERAVLVSYEELTQDPNGWLGQQICPLVGLAAPEAIKPSLRKQSWQPLSERIENYDRVAKVLQSPAARQYYAWPREAGQARAA